MAKGNSHIATNLARLRADAEWLREHPGIYPMERWLRLPLALSKAGQFDEAINEFHRLLDEVEERVKNEAPRQSPAIRQKFAHLNYFQIYDQMSSACKRQKLVNQAQQYAALAEQHYQVFMDMSVESGHYKSRH
ncbi:hypothetical protein [Methylomonas fluvii]|uniref:Tetratricopeptide repeat protein n=1 Tax=Methylomonas fluvii TaxID=1854564 RepID=A0ABR9DE04_9GAMM|nr:hypothetical protein [Methylomonas fluvii]MBD9361325.1 hypothetical protein [Methylomonas fluvii]